MNAGDGFAGPEVPGVVRQALGIMLPDLIYGDSIEVDASGAMWCKTARAPGWNRYSMFTHHQSIFYRRDLLAQGYDLAYRFSGDWALTARILALKGAQALRIPAVICHFGRDGVSQRADVRPVINREHWRILRHDMRLSWLMAQCLYRLKLGANGLRTILPGFYDLIRFRKPGV